MSEPTALHRHPGRVAGWLVFVLALTLLNYLGRYASDDTPDDVAYQWVSSVAIVVQFGIMLGILLPSWKSSCIEGSASLCFRPTGSC